MTSIEKLMVEASDSVECIIDFDTHQLQWMNKAMSEMFPEVKQGDLCHRIFFDRLSPCQDCPFHDISQLSKQAEKEIYLENKQCRFRMSYQYAEIGGKKCCVCTGTDVTNVQSGLTLAQDVLDSLHVMAYIIDRHSYELRFANRTLQKLLPDAAAGKKCFELLWDRTEPCEMCPMTDLKANHSGNTEIYNPKFNRLLSLDGMLLKTVQNEDLVVFTGHDITHRLEYESRLKKLAFFDSMLDIGNLAGFNQDVEKLVASGQSAHLCLVSIRNFNNVNVLFGRERGDHILKSFANGFSRHVSNGKVYRVGGCKFAFMTDSVETGETVLNDTWEYVFTTLSSEEKNFSLPVDSVFIGFPRFAATAETLLINAEYKLKMNTDSEYGKQFVFNDHDLRMMERRFQLISVIRNAISNEQFRVFYQPIYSFEDHSCRMVEALLRLNDERLGWITPGEFIPISEEQGLIHDLGLYVLKQVCKKLVERKAQGLPPVVVHINVSTIQFSRSGFFDDFMGIIDAHGIDPAMIVLEVTESIMIQSFDFIMSVMTKFMERGIRFSLDDFGTGYSSLSYIAVLPISSIKLDKSFIDRSEKSEVYALLIKNVVEIARGLQLELIMEGVETLKQVNALKKIGCRLMQGYYFSRPLPDTDLDTFLTQDMSSFMTGSDTSESAF